MEKHYQDVNMEDHSTTTQGSTNNQNSSNNEDRDQCMGELEDNGVLSPHGHHEQSPT